jgi:hypothetical protein
VRIAPLIAFAFVAACRDGGRKPSVNEARIQARNETSNEIRSETRGETRKEPSMTAPKQILFYDGDRLVDKDDFARVPDSVRYVTVDGQRVEVAKVVRKDAPNGQAIELYDASGRLLSRTLMIKGGPGGGKDAG